MAQNEGSPVKPLLVGSALIIWCALFLAIPGAVQAQTPTCNVSIGRVDSADQRFDPENVITHKTAETPYRIPSDTRDVILEVHGDVAIPLASATVFFGPIPVYSIDSKPLDANGTRTIHPADFPSFGGGLYQVVATISPCEQVSLWIDLQRTGVTPATLFGLGVAAVGVVTAATGLIAGARGGGGLGRSVIGGAALGAGALIVAQQSGVVPVDTGSAVVWTLLPGGLGGLSHVLLGGFIARRPEQQPTGPGYGPGAYGQQPGYGQPETSAPPEPTPLPTPPITAVAGAGTSGGPGGSAGTGSTPPPDLDAAGPPPPEPLPEAVPEPEPITTGGHTTRGGHPTKAEPPGEEAAPPPPDAEAASRGESGGEAVPAPATAGAPPRSSYAHIECPEAVVAEQQFELVVGLAQEADSEVVGGPLIVPERIVGAYTMTIQVIADGFRLVKPDESWRIDLPVTGEAPYPTGVLHLAAEAQDRPIVARTVRAMYSIDGQAVGLAARPIAVARDAALLATSEPPPKDEPVDIVLPTDAVAADLTIRIDVGQPAGRLLMQLLASDAEIEIPTDPLVIDIGNEPGLFLRDIIRKMNAAEGQPGMYAALMGIGLTIADQLPDEFWDVIRAVATRIPDRPPTILFLSAEPYVPWELAVMEPSLDPSLPPFLAAQASVGRWVLGQHRPKLPPPATLAVHKMAVVSGIYNLPGWDRLLDAEKEADELADLYKATKVNAASQDVLRLVSGQPQAELLHFAVHGQYDPNGEIDGIVLVDGLTLDPMQIRGSPLTSRPFVFLNACQVGSGEAVLGDYAGMAEAFLFAGASGVIAPLWSIDDVMARELALRFYEKALTGRTPADILREERAAFKSDPSTISSTYLAYQYFGHPHMTIAGRPE
jgi:CHAT domain